MFHSHLHTTNILGSLTWVDLLICRDTIGINDVLEPLSELVVPVVRGRNFLCFHAIQDRRNRAPTSLLQTK